MYDNSTYIKKEKKKKEKKFQTNYNYSSNKLTTYSHTCIFTTPIHSSSLPVMQFNSTTYFIVADYLNAIQPSCTLHSRLPVSAIQLYCTLHC